MQTAWIRMRLWVTWRLTQVQAAWHSDDISPTLSNTEAIWKLKQTRNLIENNLFSWLCVKGFQWNFIHMITLKWTCSWHNFCAGQFSLCRVMALGFGKYGSEMFVARTSCTVLMGISMKLHTNIHHPMFLCYIYLLSSSVCHCRVMALGFHHPMFLFLFLCLFAQIAEQRVEHVSYQN